MNKNIHADKTRIAAKQMFPPGSHECIFLGLKMWGDRDF